MIKAKRRHARRERRGGGGNDNHFKFAGGKNGMKVSWQVTGVRQDAWANAHRIPLEEEKPAAARGTYLHPEAFGQAPLAKQSAASADSSSTRRPD